MADIRFDDDDGAVQLHLGDHDAILRGRGVFSYRLKWGLRSVGLGIQPSRDHHALTFITGIATVLSLIAAGSFWVWLWATGNSAPPFVSVSAKIASVALVGSFISFGGVSLASIKAQVGRVAAGAGTCPFLRIRSQANDDLRRPGNPYVCVKCPLGIDIASDRPGGLIHVCSVYPEIHQEWRALPNADRILRPA